MSLPRQGRAGGRIAIFLSVASALLALSAALQATAAAPRVEGSLALDVETVPLDPSDASRESIGPLVYRGGLWLRGNDPRFGGLSDLRVSADGETMVAVSDCGSGFSARLRYDGSGRLVGMADARIVGLTGTDGNLLGADDIDAESLVARPGGALEVGFEGRGRVQSYGPAFEGPARQEEAPPELAACNRNGGLELMVDAGDGKRLLVCEERRGASTTVPAWIGGGREAWQEREYPLTFDGGWAAEPFRPTGAARLPNGDLLVVERRFPPLAARLVLLEHASLGGRGALEPRELARIEPPLTLDNFEGVDARGDARGRTLVYVLSDDNNCAKVNGAARRGIQRTLLLMFELVGSNEPTPASEAAGTR
jgi:hypothetical protein